MIVLYELVVLVHAPAGLGDLPLGTRQGVVMVVETSTLISDASEQDQSEHVPYCSRYSTVPLDAAVCARRRMGIDMGTPGTRTVRVLVREQVRRYSTSSRLMADPLMSGGYVPYNPQQGYRYS